MRDLAWAMPAASAKKHLKVSVSTKILNLSILASIVLFGLLYMFEVNALGTRGYQIRKLEQQVRQVQAEQKNLQVQASDLQSIDLIQGSAQKLNFVPTANVTYLKDSDYALK